MPLFHCKNDTCHAEFRAVRTFLGLCPKCAHIHHLAQMKDHYDTHPTAYRKNKPAMPSKVRTHVAPATLQGMGPDKFAKTVTDIVNGKLTITAIK